MSPFEVLADKFDKQPALPQGPVLSPAFEILPDAELVYGPSTVDFVITSAVNPDSPLAEYREMVDERPMNGVEIVEKISLDYSVNPRLLLAILDYQTSGLSGSEAINDYPLVSDEPARKGLFRQVSWLANELNRGFYTRRVGRLERFYTLDGVEMITSPDANDATAAIQYALGRMLGYHDWLVAAGPLGVNARYLSLFGSPLESVNVSEERADIEQPVLILPFGDEGLPPVSDGGLPPASHGGWFFTSGPHSAWGNGSAWAALDFAPDEENFGCYESNAWVLASADGLVVRSEDGIVVQDLDGDGKMGTGWTILYMHIAERDRVDVGTFLNVGGRIGYPSCEGGPATGTHLHLARRYNGEWIPADQGLPFVLSGWISAGAGVEYDGTLSRNDITVEASGFPTDEHKILN